MLVGGSTRCIQVAAGANHSLLLTACGSVLSAGCNVYGQLGLGCKAGSNARPVFTPVGLPGGAKASAVSAGSDHSAAASYPDGKLFLWVRTRKEVTHSQCAPAVVCCCPALENREWLIFMQSAPG